MNYFLGLVNKYWLSIFFGLFLSLILKVNFVYVCFGLLKSEVVIFGLFMLENYLLLKFGR